mmetsp:Transcript_48602/g.113455  ORF Transcript_48602/g.113455 Transcript_48602/m.113455 type:complete len:201 (+) Transcript_48602:425-1027(+)
MSESDLWSVAQRPSRQRLQAHPLPAAEADLWCEPGGPAARASRRRPRQDRQRPDGGSRAKNHAPAATGTPGTSPAPSPAAKGSRPPEHPAAPGAVDVPCLPWHLGLLTSPAPVPPPPSPSPAKLVAESRPGEPNDARGRPRAPHCRGRRSTARFPRWSRWRWNALHNLPRAPSRCAVSRTGGEGRRSTSPFALATPSGAW